MAIAFVKQWAQWQATSPSSSASITPGAAGNTLAVFSQNESGASRLLTPSAAAGTQLNPPAAWNDANGDTHAISVNLSLTGSAQVATITGTSGADSIEAVGVEYSGVGSVGSGSKINPSTPGAGAGLLQGNAVVVPVGSVLVARAVDVTALTDTITVAGGGTSRASNNDGSFPAFAVGEWAGTGGSITPSFTATAGAAQNYAVQQFILTPPVASGGSVQPAETGSVRNRPGRGPYSTGAYFRPSIDAFTKQPQTVSVPLATLTLTGFAPTVLATGNNVIAVPAGSLTMTGLVPVVTATANQFVAVPLATLTLNGLVPTVTATAGNYIAVPVGALTLTGLAPIVQNGSNQIIDVPKGSLTLTGFAPTVTTTGNQLIAVPAGSLSVTGFAPTIVTSGNQAVAVPAGSLLLTGFAPSVLVSNHQIVPVPKGALTLTGYAPSVQVGGAQLIAVPLGVLTLTVYAPLVIATSGATSQTRIIEVGAANRNISVGQSVRRLTAE